MDRSHDLIVASVLAVLLLAACGGDRTPEPPWGLDSVAQPSDEASIKQVLAAMPDAVAGRQRAASYDPLRIEYGQGDRRVTLRAMRLGEAAAAQGWAATVLGFLQGFVSGETEVEAQELDPGSDLVYVVDIIPETSGGHKTNSYVVAWGEPDSEWMFTATADSPENRIALVQAFVEAARSVG